MPEIRGGAAPPPPPFPTSRMGGGGKENHFFLFTLNFCVHVSGHSMTLNTNEKNKFLYLFSL